MDHRAFPAMPFREELRWIRESIRDAANQLSIQLRAADETLVPGEEIVPGIRQEIRAASLAYAVLTDLNPNVMYELGLLHEASKPTILLVDRETVHRLPFDIRNRTVVIFEQNVHAAEDLTRAIITATGLCSRFMIQQLARSSLQALLLVIQPVSEASSYRSRTSIGRRLRTTG